MEGRKEVVMEANEAFKAGRPALDVAAAFLRLAKAETEVAPPF